MNPRVKKNKIVDVLIVDGDFHLIKHRISNVYDYVHKILIIKTSDEKINQKVYADSSPWIDKIIFLDEDSSKSFIENYDLKLILPTLKTLEVFFEDLICFSKLTELPNYSDFDSVSEHLKFEPVILRMVDLVYNTKIHCINKHLGSYCLNFAQVINNHQILKKLTTSKKRIISDTMHVVDNGFNFNFFPETDTELTKTLRTNIHPDTFNQDKKKYLTDYEGLLHFKSNFLPQQLFLEDIGLKTLVVINHKQKKIEDFWVNEYDRVFNFNYTQDFSIPEKTILGRIYNLNIFIPPHELYDTEGDFFHSYFYNQIIKKLHGMNLMNNQNLDFVSYYERFEIENIKTFKWSQVKMEIKGIIN